MQKNGLLIQTEAGVAIGHTGNDSAPHAYFTYATPPIEVQFITHPLQKTTRSYQQDFFLNYAFSILKKASFRCALTEFFEKFMRS